MKLIHRFAYYLGGLGIGIVILMFFLSGKKTSCDYSPNDRVLKNIRTKGKEFSPESQAFFATHTIDTLSLYKILKNGDVDFDESKISSSAPCNEYVVKGKYKNDMLKFTIANCDSIATINKVDFYKE